jgi:hypothetical protein
MIKYRAGSDIDRGVLADKTWRLETAWTLATLLIFFGLFGPRTTVFRNGPEARRA